MIHSFNYCIEKGLDVGEVVAVREYIVHLSGLSHVTLNEGVSFENGMHGYVTRIDENGVWVILFSKETMELSTRAVRTGKKLTISCGDGMLGHVISPLGYILDSDKDPSEDSVSVTIDKDVWGVEKRKLIGAPLYTGNCLVDLTLPLGAGQRELVIGERKTGKTWFALQTLVNQVKAGRVGIYCAIGKQIGEIERAREWLSKSGMMKNIIIVAAGARENPAEVVIAPLTAMTVAEHMRDDGRDVLVVLDDMTTHAKYYREISLVLGKFPGRDSYPGDIFYLQSKLLERAGCFDISGREKTISCLALAESVGGDLTGYIQTNLMSITDGHIFFDIDRFQHGARPAIDIFLSVTRVGRQTRSKLLHEVSTEIYSILKKVEGSKMFYKFGPEQTDEVRLAMQKGENMDKLLTQTDILYEEWEMLYLYAWYRREERVELKPNELLEKLKDGGHVDKWKQFLMKAETVTELSDFVNKHFK